MSNLWLIDVVRIYSEFCHIKENYSIPGNFHVAKFLQNKNS